MDQILVVGYQDCKLKQFLAKMGYNLLEQESAEGVPELLKGNVVDLVMLDGRIDIDGIELCRFFRSQDATKCVPIVYATEKKAELLKLKHEGFEKIDYVAIPYKIGTLASKIATELRLRKMAGEDDVTATLGEMNASLRDLNNKFTKELEEARAIQQSLLPKSFPQDERFDIAASYEPLEEVGGDWFYVDQTEDKKIRVQIADVTGHGLSAAFIGSMTKLALVAAARDMPHELLEQMNKLMAPNMPEGKFVTMFSYLYDPEDGKLDLARAGHLPGFHLSRSENTVHEILGDGFAVGFFEEGEYSHEKAQLEVGDVLVVLTDAIPESQNMAGEVYGFERLKEVMIASKPEDTAADILTKIIHDFDDYREGRLLKDDVTVIALKRLK